MIVVLLMVAWILTVIGLLGCVFWLELRYNLFSWGPQGGFASVAPYLVIAVLATIEVSLAKAGNSQGGMTGMVLVGFLAVIVGAMMLPREKIETKAEGSVIGPLKLKRYSDLSSLCRALTTTMNRAASRGWLDDFFKRSEASPLWYRIHRFVIMAIPFFISMWVRWTAKS